MGSFKEFYLNENPDRVSNSVWVQTPSARTFGYINDNFFVSKNVTNHPDFVIHLLNSKQISFNDLPKKSQDSGEVDRNSFKYAGRLWTKEKIISFWSFPSKSDFDKLIIDLKNNGINVDDKWKVDIEKGSKNKLEPITNYSNKLQNIQVKQVDHLVDPMLKKKDPKVTPGSVHKYNKVVPKEWSIAKYNHTMKQESLEENSNLERLEKLLKNKVITKSKAIETITSYLLGVSLRRNFGQSLEDYFLNNPKEKIAYDAYINFKNKLLKEDVPTSVAPTSVATGQFQKKLGDVGKRPSPYSSKEEIKKKIKAKLKKKSTDLDKYLKP